MRTILAIMLSVTSLVSVYAAKFTYNFNNTPVSEALVHICKDHPDINISFIYKELDKYRTSAKINTEDSYEALRHIVGLNPISVVKKGNNYYIEAMQRGRFCYTGQVTNHSHEPVASATVMLLMPADSTVITYGITDAAGRFSIPCDRQRVVGKFTCLGYETLFRSLSEFYVGTVVMTERAELLGEIKVESENAHLLADKSIYIPTFRQKNAADGAMDLITRMSIPQLRIGEDVKTVNGQPVDIYIDYVPATAGELSGMRTADVKRVEYYDYPMDPRFQGHAHVINFIMQRYEYGGYVKGRYYDNFVISRQLNTYAKIQYKKMTFDWAGGPFYYNNRKGYEDTYETYRLPQLDGTVKEFERSSVVNDALTRQNVYWGSVKAQYQTKDITMSNMVSFDLDNTPQLSTCGTVSYSPAEFRSTEYNSTSSKRVNSFVFNGYWFAKLPHDNSLTFNPYYAFTHTSQNSIYDEIGMDIIRNAANDNSHQASGDLSFVHSFGSAGTLKLVCQGRILHNRTHYSGTSTLSDKARTIRIGPGINYSYSNEKLYTNAGIGLSWDNTVYADIRDNSTAPRANLSAQYALNKKHTVSIDFDYGKSIPSSGYRSASVVQANPLMSYTGNPSLVPYNSFQMEGTYVFVPCNKYKFSAFGWAWVVDNRYVFDYEATPTGILRAIKQPMGSYAQWQYGVQASSNLLQNNLQISASVYMEQAHNGAPYHWTKAKVIGSMSVYYYLKNLYFGSTYSSTQAYPDGCMVGTWMEYRPSYTFQIGWNSANWNIRFYTRNFFRYNTYSTKGTMESTYYDLTRYIHNASSAGFFQISAAYTLSFGKKVSSDNEAYQASGASSGILK
ncbi:MAG: TonB-dependent receptor family protein [Muribaculaceae bacterium]|nr:TonB-dependent receptor family protein [Muribaculaceae bacterium]